MKAQQGPAKAATASAHKIARIIYVMLKEQKEFVDLGSITFNTKIGNTKSKDSLKRPMH